ncbi:MAG TPA: hypothetical protein VEH29_08495, partial [Acidimicrobiales bacterium]|nr:hypothetical protein [Acidimicrobiales bacterium]
VAKVVEAKVREARWSTPANKGLRHPVRLPGRITVRAIGEDESMQALAVDAFIGGELPKRQQTRTIEVTRCDRRVLVGARTGPVRPSM